MPDLILHHYGISPFSEKVRLAFGLKNLSWRSVTIPMVAPKPDLVALTGGYRHTPVLQIGADIHCDTRRILRELDDRFPQKLLVRPGEAGLNAAIEAWAERDLFWPIARYLTGMNGEAQEGFHADRAALRGKEPPSIERVQAAARASLPLIQAQLPLVASLVGSERRFILADSLSQADLAVYHALWFLSTLPTDCSEVLDPHPEIRSWMSRVASIGHGTSTEMSSHEAIEVARMESPAPITQTARRSLHDPAIGSIVAVRPDGYSTEETRGELVHLDRDHIAIACETPEVGRASVHFPRIGYLLRPVDR